MLNRKPSLRFAALFVVIAAATVATTANWGTTWAESLGLTAPTSETATESSPEGITAPAAMPFVIGTCDVATALLPIEVEATAGTLGPTPYANLTAAFAAINAGTHQGAINVEVCFNSTETAAMFLNSGAGAAPAAYTSISIRPLADGLTISGAFANTRKIRFR